MRAKEMRAKAREVLKRNWGTAIATTLVAAILGVFGVGSYSGSKITEKINIEPYLSTHFGRVFFVVLGSLLSALAIWSVVRFILGGALKLGYRKFTVNMVRDGNGRFEDLFSRFNDFGKGFLMQLLLDIFMTLWTLLFVIPGIIMSFAYAMTPYILNDHPEMTPMEAIKESKRMMKGNKWRLFCLHLSFIGWHILAAFTFGIGYLWLNPYIQVSEAAFYEQISREQAGQSM